MTRTIVLLAIAFVPMLVEAARSRRNEAALRRAGAVEPPGDVYKMMQVTYPAAFLAMAGEGWQRDIWDAALLAAGGVVFAAGKAIKYWAIATLGDRWSFRVLVLPGAPLIRGGPYRWLRHPNYVGVAGELVGFALLAAAPVAGVISCVAFGGLLIARIAVEERALGLGGR